MSGEPAQCPSVSMSGPVPQKRSVFRRRGTEQSQVRRTFQCATAHRLRNGDNELGRAIPAPIEARRAEPASGGIAHCRPGRWQRISRRSAPAGDHHRPGRGAVPVALLGHGADGPRAAPAGDGAGCSAGTDRWPCRRAGLFRGHARRGDLPCGPRPREHHRRQRQPVDDRAEPEIEQHQRGTIVRATAGPVSPVSALPGHTDRSRSRP